VKKILLIVVLFALAVGTARGQKLTGAGATFPYPIYAKWFREYDAAHDGVSIRYRAIGSGAGIRQVAAGVVDFGATDAPMTDNQLAASRTRLIHIPALMGAVVPIFHVQGVSDLRLSGEVLADIYLGRIVRWNDPRIARDNPDAHLPDQKIVVVYRSESSGTSFIFTDYLSKVSRAWAGGPGKSGAPNWPVGVGAVRNEGVARVVRATDGSLGYVELIYALENHVEFSEVKNSSGNWIKASSEGIAEAAENARELPRDFRVSITNAPGANAYPIASFSWLLVPVRSSSPAKGRVLKELLTWILTTGQSEAKTLSYAPLPKPIAAKVLETIGSLR
jgi:phosphate transport system substrate-binding protein